MNEEWEIILGRLKPEGRLSRDDYFMEIAQTVSKRGTCPRLAVGAIVVDGRNRILGTGYNGSPPGHPHCHDVGCCLIMVGDKQYCIRSIHAEVNALLTVETSADILIMYSTHKPCFECIKVIVAKGITVIKYREEYRDPKWERIQDEYSKRLTFQRIQ